MARKWQKMLQQMLFLHTHEQSLVTCEKLEYKIDSKSLDSSRDKEHDDAQFLQIGVSMAKLQPLLNHCRFFMKCVFCAKFL